MISIVLCRSSRLRHSPFDIKEIRSRYGSQRVMTRTAYPMEEANA
jgi:hypothetical protein